MSAARNQAANAPNSSSAVSSPRPRPASSAICPAVCGHHGPLGKKRFESCRTASVPAAEAAFAVDDLAGDPGRLVGDQPGDQAGGVVGEAPALLREVTADRLVGFG